MRTWVCCLGGGLQVVCFTLGVSPESLYRKYFAIGRAFPHFWHWLVSQHINPRERQWLRVKIVFSEKKNTKKYSLSHSGHRKTFLFRIIKSLKKSVSWNCVKIDLPNLIKNLQSSGKMRNGVCVTSSEGLGLGPSPCLVGFFLQIW